MVAGVEEIIGNLLPPKDEPGDSLFNCTDLEDVEIPPGGAVLTPLLVLAPSLTPSVGWLLLSVSPRKRPHNIMALLDFISYTAKSSALKMRDHNPVIDFTKENREM